MTMSLQERQAALKWVDSQNGTVDRKIFFSEDVYRMELEQVFARAWLFMAHESQIPNPGDFFLNFMGEDRVIVVRAEKEENNKKAKNLKNKENGKKPKKIS